MKVAYIRVSTVEQNTSRQEQALKDYGIEKFFIEKVSGKNMNRPKLQEMLEFVREGDICYCVDFSRMARSCQNLLSICEILQNKGVHLVSLKENFDTSTPQGRLMLTIIAAINAFERENILERQREGIAIAKAEGKYKGRKPIEVEDFAPHYKDYMSRRATKGQLAKKLHISRPTLNKLFDEYEKSQSVEKPVISKQTAVS